MNTRELELYNASQVGDVANLKAVLTATPSVNVNKQNPDDVSDDRVMQTNGGEYMVWWCRTTTRR